MATPWYSNPPVALSLAILLLWEFWGFHSENGKVFCAGIGGKLNTGKTVYDVSQIIRSNEQPNDSEILSEDLYVREVNNSANYYFLFNDAADEETCDEERPCQFFGIKGISLIFSDKASKTDILAMTDIPTHNITIPNLLKLEKSSVDSVTILLADNDRCEIISVFKDYLSIILNINIKHSIQVGIEFSGELLELCAEEGVSNLDYLDHTILRIHVAPKTTMLSYAVFSRNLHKLIEKNRKFVRKICPRCTPYIRLHNFDWNTSISADNYEKYNALMTAYLDSFSKQNSGKEEFIFSPTLKQLNILPYNVFLTQNVLLPYRNFKGVTFENVSSHDKHLLSCAHQHVVKLLLPTFANIMLNDLYLEVVSSLSTVCKTPTENLQNRFIPPSNMSFSLVWSSMRRKKEIDNQVENLEIDKQVEKLLVILHNNPAGIKIATVYIDAEDFNKTESLAKAVNLLQSQNIDVACYASTNWLEIKIETTNISAIIGETIKKCGLLINLTKEIRVRVSVEIGKADDVFKFLNGLNQAKQHSETVYPGKTLTLEVLLETGLGSEVLYCSNKEKQLKEYYQTIYSFANIQGWSKFLAGNFYNDFEFWHRVKPKRKIISNIPLKFPVLFRSNAQPTSDKELPMTYPCIQKTVDAWDSNIIFLENQYSGATIQTNLRENLPLSTAELQTLLELAKTSFPSVEIIASSQSDFKLAKKVVGANAQNFHNKNAPKPSVYIELPLAEVYGFQQDIYTFLSNTHAAVHVSNWESLSNERHNLWEGVQDAAFGITVQNCIDEVNSELKALKSLPFMPQVSYIVCNTSRVVTDNGNEKWMEKYLETMFYIKSYMEHFLSYGRETGNEVEVMFRLNYFCPKANRFEKFLRFLNDVNQHSAAYKIRYFLVRVFEGETSANCSSSWWRPDSYADLSNISNYVNREDEYAGREARIFQAPVPPSAAVPDQTSITIYLIIVVPIVTFLVLVVLALLLYQKKLQTSILTQKEVRSFYNGGEQSSSSSNNENFLDFSNMKFPKNYEIPRKDIETEEIIGKGQFGVVHRGILSKNAEVAIKIPRSDCGKEQFKSTLSELKILCHIGEHMNIVSFLGACTKGIANGRLFIVIEYCKNGCLLQFLRQNQESDTQCESISLYQMYGFSLQIASGMEYIAEKRVVHGDLAARNVLLTSEWTCKIADFGLSRRVYEMSEYAYIKTGDDPLPWRWMAPESLRNMEFTSKSDVWSYGVTLWEIFSLGMVPYPGLIWTANFATELENGMRMGKALHATDSIHAKTLDCWKVNSDARPTFTELKEYFVGLRNEQYLNLNKV